MANHDTPGYEFDTRAIRAGTLRTPFGEHSEALFLTSSFVFDSAAQAAERFAGTDDGYVYSRFTNPTVRMFEQRLAALEGAEDCLATASGMSAIMAICLAALKAGDHVVCGANVFGSTVQLFSGVLARFGIDTTFVDSANSAAWRAAATPRTRLLFCETPSNPLMEVTDLTAFGALGRELGALTVVDNCFCTPVAQRPLEFGVDVVMHSATKYLDGQGRVLGGAVLGSRRFVREQVLPVLRTTGPSLSPFNAWVMLKGLETLGVRMRAQCAAALELAQWLERQPGVARVHFPGLQSHPQAALCARQQSLPGAVVSFEVVGDSPQQARANAWRVIDRVRLMSITANLGDTRTTITHPATTTHGRISPEARERAGIREGLIRIAVGLETVADLQRDLAHAFAA
ncbi:MAG TPA: O-succinylhomoserine sulfhydrylase [Burkholderiaceae bacterium]|nr:O-succinylhomoserine sulfhydrylase [Burkholderiaceae bacterium]HQR70007.1 O-succinylhomoserine sulfhydrylase [Burkholderiaceae bacterium]